MNRNWVRLLVIIGALALLAAAFIWIVAPWRARSLAATYEKFRSAFQADHDALDAQFHQRDRTVNGLSWHFVEEGDPAGKAVLFLHGLPEGWYSWRYVLPKIDHRFRLIAVDMKGYGRSDRGDADYNWHRVAAQTADFMESLGINKFFVVSHDWGTIIGSVLVADRPERILGYVRMEADLVPRRDNGMLAAYAQKPQWLLFQSNWIASYLMADPGWFIDSVYSSRMTTPLSRTDRDYLVYEFSRPGVAEMVPRYFLHDNWDLDAAIGAICKNDFSFPVLQLQADRDPAQPRSIFTDAAAQCPHVRIEWVIDAGHFDNFDQPGQVADAINRFLHTTQPAAAAREKNG